MFTNDYIMRQIELLVWAVARIIGLKQENRLEECEGLYQDTLRKFFGLTERSIEELPWRNLMAVASLGGLPDAERCALLAQLIREKADVDGMRGLDGRALYEKALCIYLAAWESDESVRTAEHGERIDGLRGLVDWRRMPGDGLELLLCYFEQTGRYAPAEDALYVLLETGVDGAAEMGRAFYLRLMERDDGELARGGLPREEVRDGLRRLGVEI